MSALEVIGLHVTFGGRLAVRDLSLQVDAGEALGVIGPNGAGKTTMIDAVTGFVRYQGSVLIAGTSIDGCPPHERVARGIARTFQAVELFDDLTVRENLAVSPMSSRPSIARALALTGLVGVAEHRAGDLTRPVRTVVGLARAIAATPAVILLDEIAAGLPASARSAMLHQLHDVMASGTALVVIDHDREFIERLCSRVIAMDAGAITADSQRDDVHRGERATTPPHGAATGP